MVPVEVDLVAWAWATAQEHLHDLEPRWSHVQQVGALATAVAEAFPAADRSTLVAAAILHDVGYSAALAKTRFHPLDGARFVRDQGFPEVAALVAHHSGARHEAAMRGVDLLPEFPYAGSDLDEALTFCDLTTSPVGSRIRLDERVEEIQNRYGSDHVVARAIAHGHAEFRTAVTNTEARLRRARVVLSGSLAYPD